MSPSRTINAKVAAAIATTGLVLVSLSGCAAGDGGSVGGNTTLTIAVPAAPQSLDPGLGTGGQQTVFIDTAYQSLFHVKGNTDVAPSLASGYEWSDQNRTLTVTLKPDVQFSDGEALDSAAVKTWVEYFKAQGGPHSYAAAPLDSIETPDDQTVVFHLKTASPQFLYNLTEATGMGAIVSPKALADKADLNQGTYGAGPFTISMADTVDGSTYTYVPNPHYFDPDSIDFTKVIVKVIANANTAYAALRSGQVDVTFGDAANIKAAKSAGLNEVAFPVNVAGMWTSDPQGAIVPALADVRVRQALQYAIDRKSIAEAAAPGSGEATVQPVTTDSIGYDESLETQYPFDLDKAKSLLAEAGYADGFPLAISVAPGTDHLIIAQAIADQLAKVNVTVTLSTPASFGEWVQDVTSGKYAAVVIGLGLTGMPTTMDNLFGSPALINFNNSSYPDLVDAAAAASVLDEADSNAAWKKVTAKAVEDAYQLPIVVTSSIYFSDTSVAGVDGAALLNPAFLTSAK